MDCATPLVTPTQRERSAGRLTLRCYCHDLHRSPPRSNPVTFLDQQVSAPGFKYGTAPNEFLCEQAARRAPSSAILLVTLAMQRADVASVTDASFEALLACEGVTQLDEGSGHHGDASVVRFVVHRSAPTASRVSLPVRNRNRGQRQ